ncbi:hypothetical protein Hanom_Chr00s000002g01599921 [Helianthus anomalus]
MFVICSLFCRTTKLSCGTSSAVNEDLPPSPPHTPINEQLEGAKATGEDEAERVAEAGNPEVEKPVEVVVETGKVVSPGAAGEKGISAQEDHVVTSPSAGFASAPVNVKKVPVEYQSSFAYENSPIRPDEILGDYYYRSYSEKNSSENHAPVWNLKKGDTFSDWRVCRDWLQGTFPPGEIKFQEGRPHEQTYHAYLE